jgi:uncharacterized membrane protein
MNARGAVRWPVMLAVLGVLLAIGMLVMGQLLFAIPVLLIALVVGIGSTFANRGPRTP